jgi:diphthamide synthase (EF-2-diphthine--ammonia ligase)
MKNDKREDYVVRDAILKLLSDAELSNVSAEETETALKVGQEFIDLKQLKRGVRTAGADQVVMGRVLSRKAVHNDTWEKILTTLSATK